METNDGLYHAKPQIRGKMAHESIDNKTTTTLKDVLLSLPVYSTKYKLMGKIDLYRKKEKLLIERKYKLKRIYQGQIYQLWAQYFCLLEMGYDVQKIAFYEISTNKMFPIELPSDVEAARFSLFINDIRQYHPMDIIRINPNRCKHCIYCSICDKTEEDNVYQ